MKTAARLKKEQRKERKDQLRSQEDTLRRQIEKYDQLITDGYAEMEKTTDQVKMVLLLK